MSNDNPLGDLFEDLDKIEKDTPTKPQPKKPDRRAKFRSALDEDQSDRRKVAKATGKKATVAGSYIRRSFTYRPDQLDSIDKAAAQLRLSKNDLIRWFVDLGIQAVEDGATPPIAEEVRHRYNPKR